VAAPRLGAEKLGFGAGEDTGRHLSVGRGGLGGAGYRRSDHICRREEEEEEAGVRRFAGHGISLSQ
jgi:hypothetical protein